MDNPILIVFICMGKYIKYKGLIHLKKKTDQICPIRQTIEISMEEYPFGNSKAWEVGLLMCHLYLTLSLLAVSFVVG